MKKSLIGFGLLLVSGILFFVFMFVKIQALNKEISRLNAQILDPTVIPLGPMVNVVYKVICTASTPEATSVTLIDPATSQIISVIDASEEHELHEWRSATYVKWSIQEAPEGIARYILMYFSPGEPQVADSVSAVKVVEKMPKAFCHKRDLDRALHNGPYIYPAR